MGWSDANPAWGRMMREKQNETERSRREAETALAARIRAENPGFTWGEAMRRALAWRATLPAPTPTRVEGNAA